MPHSFEDVGCRCRHPRGDPAARLHELQCDLADLDSVRSCADRFAQLGIPALHVVLLNAGAALIEYAESPQGLEMMFALNYLGHYLLVGLLLPYVKDVPDSRVIPGSSIGHRSTNIIDYQIARGQAKDKFSYFRVYCETKLAMHWFAAVLNEKFEAAGAKTIAVAAAPGAARTELARNATGLFWKIMMLPIGLFTHPARNGAYPYLFAATDPDLKKGNYYEPGRWWGLNGNPVSKSFVSEAARDIAKAKNFGL